MAANRATVLEAAPGVAAGDATPKKPKSLRPLLMLRPYILRHARMLVLAGVALVISAIAMLAVPMAARRMVDYGFADRVGTFINQYFVMLIFIGLVISCASSARFFLVNWLGERVVSDVRSDVFRHLAKLGPAFFDRSHSGEIMSRLTADTTLIKSASGSTISQAIRNLIMLVGRPDHDVHHQPVAVAAGAGGDPADHAAVPGRRPRGPAAVAAGAGHARGKLGLRGGKPRRGAHHAGVHA